MVLAHARALMADRGHGRTTVLQADLREPEKILAHPELTSVIDFDEPVGVMQAAVLHFIRDSEDPVRLVRTLRDALPPGSHLVLSHCTLDFTEEQVGDDLRGVCNQATAPLVPRSHEEISAYFDGFDLVDPGLIHLPLWRPDMEVARNELSRVHFYAGVGRLAWHRNVRPEPRPSPPKRILQAFSD
jgi:hypothetical protein